MQFRDLKAQYLALKPQIDRAIFDAVEEGRYISGPQVRELEERLAAYVGVKHCITCANGTDALQLALMAWGVGPGTRCSYPTSPSSPAVRWCRPWGRPRCSSTSMSLRSMWT